tara:strand:+ start:1322 stop:1816 length:495 start_codon:yes stop_codon:yes gene_type:complete
MIVIDEFIRKETFPQVQDIFLNDKNFYWSWSNVVDDNTCDEIDNHQFFHMFYYEHSPVSKYWSYVVPILRKLDAKAIYSVKANCNVRTQNIVRHGFHVDVPANYNSKTAILYINTNNGYTEFENGERVESVANRLVLFDSELKHTGTTCTDQQRRVVLNLNYID